MLTPEEKRVIAEKMGWKWCSNRCAYKHANSHCQVGFSLNDAALVKDELVKRGKYEKFEDDALLEDWCKSDPARSDEVFSAWLLTVVHGEATNFFRSFAKWIEER